MSRRAIRWDEGISPAWRSLASGLVSRYKFLPSWILSLSWRELSLRGERISGDDRISSSSGQMDNALNAQQLSGKAAFVKAASEYEALLAQFNAAFIDNNCTLAEVPQDLIEALERQEEWYFALRDKFLKG